MTSVDEAHSSRRLTKIFSISSDHLNEIRSLVALENRKVSPGISTENEGSRINVISVNTNHEMNDELPDEWISYNFERKRSCILSNIYSTCVTKAINHLESLQLSIDKWISAFENQSLSSSGDESESSKIIINFIKRKSILKILQAEFTKNPDQKLRFVDQEKTKNTDGFFVHGQGIDLEKSKIVVVQNEAPVQDLHADGIMEEILMLVARLELDRKRVENLLKRERENLHLLKECIESMALKRAVELPLRVQNEHDACISDITELNWHISFNTKSERKLSRKVEIEERLYQHLKEQIATIKNNTPLIEEKIASELVIIKKIEAAQADVDQFVSKVKLKLEETQEKSQNTYKKAAKEREAIENDLANCRRELNRAKKRLQEAMNALDEYSKTIVECASIIEQNTAQEKIETAKRIELRSKNELLNDENKKIQLDIFRIEKEIEKVTKQNDEKNALIEQMIAKFNADMAKITDALNKRLDKLDKILKKKKEKEIDLEEMNQDQKNMENKIAKEERNRERLLEDRQRVEEELRDAGQDLEAAFKLNASTIADYEKEMRRLENKEDNLKKQITDLRKQIGEERTQLTNLINRIISEAEDFAQNKINSEKKKIHFEHKRAELEGRLSGLEIRVAETESKKNTLCEEVRVLNEKLDQTLKAHKQIEDDLSKKIEDLEPKHSKASIDYFTNKANLDYMKSHSIEMKSKMEEMEDSKKVMVKTIEKIGDEIKNLEVDYTEYKLQSDASKNLDDGFKLSLEEVKNRIENSKSSHDKRTQERNEYLDKLNLQLDNYLELNKELASRYRYIKYFGYNKRLDLMKQIEIKLSAFVNMKDKRQVISLQERMHNALNDYFKFRIKNGEKNYFDLKEERECIGDEINSLEDLLKKSTSHMARFLEKQTDFEQVRQKAIQKVIKQELIEQQQAESLRQRGSKRIDPEQPSNEVDFSQVGLSLRTRNRKLAATNLVSAV